MEALLFMIDALVVVALVIFSLRDDRLPDTRKTGFFRYAVDPPAAATPKQRPRR